MDELSAKYQQAAQNQLNHIEAVSKAFYQQCELLKNTTEQAISALDKSQPAAQDQENRLKLKLKKDLQMVLAQYEKELKNKFLIGLTDLEEIYRQKELQKMDEIEKQILAIK
jgi:hypothetical protein